MLQHARIVLLYFTSETLQLSMTSVPNFTLAADTIEVSTDLFRGISYLTVYLSICFIMAIFILDLYYHPRDFSDRTSSCQKHERSLFVSIVNNVASKDFYVYLRSKIYINSIRRIEELLLKLNAQHNQKRT